ncbi:hypothetical protein [Neobacillus mesonae]|uniref:hypothetical protein n=1 Tax=Neobacillus mesonae TaxID=1193713 RepID=UPI001372DE38|nr:hypothetical protein [Neobacillus mesonae]
MVGNKGFELALDSSKDLALALDSKDSALAADNKGRTLGNNKGHTLDSCNLEP